MPTDQNVSGPQDLPTEYYELVGRVASDWAGLEYIINEAIWIAAGVFPHLGACITAQIFSATNRLHALATLLKARGASKKIITRVNRFTEESRSASEKRNRIVHDMWGIGSDGVPRQLQVTAAGNLVFELRDRDLRQLRSEYEQVFATVCKFVEIRNEIAAELPSWPEIPPTERRPTIGVLDPLI